MEETQTNGIQPETVTVDTNGVFSDVTGMGVSNEEINAAETTVDTVTATDETAITTDIAETAIETDATETEETAETDDITENALDNWVSANDDDTEELADEIGVSGIFDHYGRELLKNVFENRLRLSKNSVKLMYGRLKNKILSYEGLTRRYVDKEEMYYIGKEKVFIFAVNGGELILTADGVVEKVEFDKDLDGIRLAEEKISVVAEKLHLDKKKDYTPIAYAERYQFNPDAALRGEVREPVEGEFDGAEYDPIENELTSDPLSELAEKVFAVKDEEPEVTVNQSTQALTPIAVAALTEPVVFFYNAARTSENEIGYVGVQEVLNDKFVGKMLPQQFIAVAEGSDRIVTLNLLSVEAAAKACDENPNMVFVTQVSARLLIGDAVFKKLLKAAHTENKNLVLAFDCALLEALGDKGLAKIRELTNHDIKIMIDNTENAGLRILTEINVDFLRFDARYYKEDDARKTAHLDMLTGYAKVQGINTAAVYVSTVKEAKYFLSHGVENIEGDIVGNPVRIIHNAIKGAKKLPTSAK